MLAVGTHKGVCVRVFIANEYSWLLGSVSISLKVSISLWFNHEFEMSWLSYSVCKRLC